MSGVQATEESVTAAFSARHHNHAAVMLSGLESYQTGLDSNGHLSFREGMGPTVVEQIRRAGYQTTLV
ncbi:MAG: hypothetical protein AAB403_03755, partial [Planctomycetota bacterium]